MAAIWNGWYWRLGLASFIAMGGAIASGNCAHAQVTPDVTLGAESSVVTPTAPGSPVNVIDGGATRGANLFHSFEQFSVPTRGEAFFNNAANIQNIISRVTGASISNIDGLLRANGTANLFLLNPNGIIFGPNASLNIGGSFLGSTASSVNFADGTQFSATAPKTTPLLTISVPIGLQFAEPAGDILQYAESGSGIITLYVRPNKTLALVGGNVAMVGSSLTAPGGRIELGSVSGPGLVSLNPTNKGWALGYEGVQNFQDIQLSQEASVDASLSLAGGREDLDGGEIQVQGRRVTLTEGSIISVSGFNYQAGTLTVKASESVEVIGTTDDALRRSGWVIPRRSGLITRTTGTADAGDLNISTGQLTLRDGAEINVSSAGSGAAGNLIVEADSIELDNQASLRANTTAGRGNIFLDSQDLVLRRGSNITTNATGTATGGNIKIDTGVIALDDSDITGNAGEAFGGQVIINAQGIIRTGESDITASSALGPEFSGTVEINSLDVDPTQGLVELPVELVDVSNQIATGCPDAVWRGESKFIITGRGGLPPSPTEPLRGDNTLTNWSTLDSDVENRSSVEEGATNTTRERAPAQIVEANGWVKGPNGEVTLVATATTANIDIPWLPESSCNAPGQSM